MSEPSVVDPVAVQRSVASQQRAHAYGLICHYIGEALPRGLSWDGQIELGEFVDAIIASAAATIRAEVLAAPPYPTQER